MVYRVRCNCTWWKQFKRRMTNTKGELCPIHDPKPELNTLEEMMQKCEQL